MIRTSERRIRSVMVRTRAVTLRLFRQAVAVAVFAFGSYADDRPAPVRIRSFAVERERARVEVACVGLAGESVATVEMYRADAPTGPWCFVTNDILDGCCAASEDGAVEKTYEVAHGTHAPSGFYAALLFADSDGDGLSDTFERFVTKTDALVADSDGDGLSDGEEAAAGTDPRSSDTDGDGISDGDEIALGADPLQYDTDGDGLSDYQEVYEYGTSPCEAEEDNDADGLPDAWEIRYGFDYRWMYDADGDADNDGLTNLQEYEYETDPTNADTDGDGYDDLWESMYSVRLNPERAAEEGWPRWFDPSGYPEFEESDSPVFDMTSQFVIECRMRTHPFIDDTDGDGLSDMDEYYNGLDPLDPTGDNGADGDPDGDWLTNAQEIELMTEPLYSDSDGDGVPDGMEVLIYGTNPRNSDTDGEGLLDGEETETYGTNPLNPDTDYDGLTDYEEIMIHFTNPLDGDSDGDGAGDYIEVTYYDTDPLDAYQDTDGDGLLDVWELRYGFDPKELTPLFGDDDHDGLNTGKEFELGTDPTQPDSDGDGMHDGWEYKYMLYRLPAHKSSAKSLLAYRVGEVFFNPAGKDDPGLMNGYSDDPDFDGLWNGIECQYGTNPYDADTDGDGVSDMQELANWSNPTDPNDDGKPNSRVGVIIYFGDPSESHSEKYLLHVWPKDDDSPSATNENYRVLNARYGEVEKIELMVRPGIEYNVEIVHASTSTNYECYPASDPDYALEFEMDFRWKIIVDDPEEIRGVNSDEYGRLWAAGKTLTFKVVKKNFKVTLLPDYDRNGHINDGDLIDYRKNKPLRFWINDDNDAGGGSDFQDEKNVDKPDSDNKDWSDEKINGKRDFIDFTPIWLDLSSFSNCQWASNLQVTLRQEDKALNFVWTTLTPREAGNFLTKPTASYLNKNDASLDSARVETFEEEGEEGEAKRTYVLSGNLVNWMVHSKTQGVFLVEGRCKTEKPLTVEVRYDGQVLASTNLELRISSVTDMYRWVNLRTVCQTDVKPKDEDDVLGRRTQTNDPPNRPDAETDGRNYVFVHGFNVNAAQAEAWASEMFKRLWQAGLKSSFTAVDWYGNEGQSTIFSNDDPNSSLNYYVNVKHAFKTAQRFRDEMYALPGRKVLLAHSLGNMLVSAAIKDWNLTNYEMYYMLNAAVSEEAYIGETEKIQMIDPAWDNAPREYWAANWYQLFAGTSDFREKLTWRKRFEGIDRAVNVYSESDDVLENGDTNLSIRTSSAWKLQERLKGSGWLTTGKIITFTLIDVPCEGGWGANEWYKIFGGYFFGFNKNITNVTKARAITKPLFTPFRTRSDEMMSTNRLELTPSEEYEARALFLGDAIPALGGAAGANKMGNFTNQDYSEFVVENVWPRAQLEGNKYEWRHSDIKNVAYYFNCGFFKYLIGGK